MLNNYVGAVLGSRKRFRADMPIPSLSLQVEGVRINKRHLARYNRVCGFSDDAFVAPTYLQILALPMQMAMLAQKAFPIPLLGVVHVRNVIEVRAPLARDTRFDLLVRVADHRLVAKGVEVDLLTEATAGGAVVWRAITTMLHRCKTDVPEGEKEKRATDGAVATNFEMWKLPAGLGRAYGLASGDVNPIHLAAFSARLFGFKRAIAHGMWNKARCLAALEAQLPQPPYRIEVAFKLPVYLPAKLRFAYKKDNDRIEFEVRGADGSKPHLRGSVTPL